MMLSAYTRVGFWIVKYRSDVYDVKCIHEGCPWIVHASKGRWKTQRTYYYTT
jgi:hypothetical protein